MAKTSTSRSRLHVLLALRLLGLVLMGLTAGQAGAWLLHATKPFGEGFEKGGAIFSALSGLVMAAASPSGQGSYFFVAGSRGLVATIAFGVGLMLVFARGGAVWWLMRRASR
jgi:hypothetical protein